MTTHDRCGEESLCSMAKGERADQALTFFYWVQRVRGRGRGGGRGDGDGLLIALHAVTYCSLLVYCIRRSVCMAR